MSIVLTVNNTPFEYPEQGEQAPWGEAATGWAKEVTDVLAAISGPSDILESSATIQNYQTVAQPIAGLVFDPITVRSFTVTGNIYRQSGLVIKVEEFTIKGLNNGTSWQFQQDGFGSSGVELSIDNTGQVYYISDNFAGSTGLIKFRGIGVLKT
jgi:hypothetical protein